MWGIIDSLTEVHSLFLLNFTYRCRTGSTARTCLSNGYQHAIENPCGATADVQADVLRILFSNAAIEESDEEKPGIILDFDKTGNIVGMEILDAPKRMENPMAMEYGLTG